MPWKAISPIKVYSLLPKTNCKECGAENCMAFAVGLVNMEMRLEKCPPFLDPKYRKNYLELKKILSPPVKEVEFGNGSKRIKLGGEFVMHRHELTYINPPAIAVDVDDEMSDDELLKRIKFVRDFVYTYIGTELKLDALAIRSVSNDPVKFKRAVEFVARNTDLPFVLCSLNPKVMEAGLSALNKNQPLIYAAAKENWREMAELSLEYKCPLTVFSPDLDTMRSLTKTLLDCGVSDLVLDPGTFAGDGVSSTSNAVTMLRWKACNDGDKLSGFPLIGTPITSWLAADRDSQSKAWWEAITAAMLIDRYADMLIMHSLEGWGLLPNVVLRFNIYTDPRRPVSVKPGLRTIGNPGKASPVFITSNFALTYYIVSGDIESGKIDGYLLVADAEGTSLVSAVAGRKLTAKQVAEVIKNSEVEKLVEHKTIIIPGKAARLMGDIEDETGWKVIVGPSDSSDIPQFLQKLWRTQKEAS